MNAPLPRRRSTPVPLDHSRRSSGETPRDASHADRLARRALDQPDELVAAHHGASLQDALRLTT